MAGIGFSLRKLFKDKSFFGYAKAYSWTGMVTAGPFIGTASLILGVQLLYLYFGVSDFLRYLFTESVVYPFIFSHIVVSGFNMVITRYIADKMYLYDVKSILSSMFGMLSVVLTVGSIAGLAFFALWAKLPFYLELTTFIFYMEMIIVFLLGTYVSALQNYTFIVKAYMTGVIVALLGTLAIIWFPWFENVLLWTMLMMDLGALIIGLLLLRNIYTFFGFENYCNYDFIGYFSTYKPLFFANLFYTISLYIPNMIIWLGPEGLCLAETYYYQPQYDISAFYANISILPVMMLFVVSMETRFYEKYRRYLMFITEKGNYEEIGQSRREMLRVMWYEIRNLFDIQLVVVFCFIALGSVVMPMLGLGFYGIDIFNILVLSAFCLGIVQTVVIMLLYLEDRKGALLTCSLQLLLNIIFNVICLYFGEKTYGLGAFAANFISLGFAVYRLQKYSERIDYHIFCSQPVLNVKHDNFLGSLYEKMFRKEQE